MRLGCLLPIIVVALLISGAQGLIVGLTNRAPTVLAYEDFLRQKPTRGWYEIQGGRLNLMGAIYERTRLTGRITRAFIPVTPATADGDGKIHLLLLTKDKSLLSTLQEIREAAGEGGGLAEDLKRRQAQRQRGGADSNRDAVVNALRFYAQNRDRLLLKRPVRGLIQFGSDINSKDRGKIAESEKDLADDFVVLEDGERPQPASSGLMLLTGLVLAAYLIQRAVAGKRAAPLAS